MMTLIDSAANPRSASYRSRMRTRTIVAAAAILGLTLLAPATSASAEPACFNQSSRIVTPEEYEQLAPGETTLAQTKVITGASGIPMDDPAVIPGGRMDRTWKVCAKPGWVLMSFQRVPGQGFVLQWTRVRWS